MATDRPAGEAPAGVHAPLAERMRPRNPEEFHGQELLLARGCPLRRVLEDGRAHSMVLWGAPGTGKTTLARLIARCCNSHWLALSATMSGVRDIRAAVATARKQRQQFSQDTVIFVDEAHRFNKAQQDSFLPFIEDGTLIFIGATTENPAFELNNALLSRLRVYVLRPLDTQALENILHTALNDAERGLGTWKVTVDAAQLRRIAEYADGDARRALNTLENACALSGPGAVADATLDKVLAGRGPRRFDRQGDVFYDQISALHKSLRGSDPDAALYWFARMLDGGSDPLYIARRVLRMACEDIGNADPRALTLALAAWQTQERLGSPEGELAVAQAIVYLACAAKSNAVYKAWNAVQRDVQAHGSDAVPGHLRHPPDPDSKPYRYAHDEPEAHAAGECYFPDSLGERHYYQPLPYGLEARIAERLRYLRERNQQARRSACRIGDG